VPSSHRRLRLALGIWASTVFVVLWAGAIAGAAGGGQPFEDAWRALGGLDGAARLAAWVVFLPIAVALWAANAELPAPILALVAIGLVAWTAAAWGGLVGTLRHA